MSPFQDKLYIKSIFVDSKVVLNTCKQSIIVLDADVKCSNEKVKLIQTQNSGSFQTTVILDRCCAFVQRIYLLSIRQRRHIVITVIFCFQMVLRAQRTMC